MHASFISTLLLALAASVSSLSLGDLEAIPSDTVTPGCLSAYNTEIAACPDAADFKAKKACTEECRAALSQFSSDTILVCRQAFVSPDSLLRRLLDGGLVTTLCPASSSSSSSLSSSVAAPTTTTTPAAPEPTTSSASYSAPASTKASASVEAETPASSTQQAQKTKTESAISTTTPTSVAFSGFMTITASSAASTASVPSELTLDDSAEPTVSSAYGGYAAYAVISGSSVESAAAQSSAAALNGSPFESTSDSADVATQTGAAGSVNARWGAVVLAVAAVVGAGLV